MVAMGPPASTPDEVLKLTTPCSKYLCRLSANTYNIQFRSFEVKDFDSNKLLFRTAREGNVSFPTDLDEATEDQIRHVQYTFPASFLRSTMIRTSLEFSTEEAAKNFRMIERHYFKGRLVRSYDFTFAPFCIPNSVNSWEAIYEVPKHSDKEIRDYLDHPYEHQSDSFYFVEDKLIMHNKAEYRYVEDS